MSTDSDKPVTDVKSEEKPAPAAKPVAKKPEEIPVELPAFEKGISDKIVEKFGDKVEVAFVKSILDKSYELTIDLHEDFMSPGYYLYQSGTHPEDDHIGNEILQNVKSIMPINLNDEIDGRPAQMGIMIAEEDYRSMDWWPMALYALSKGTRRCLTLETATSFSMDIRVEAHSIAIDTALNYFSEESNN